jgi:hypothetical protein
MYEWSLGPVRSLTGIGAEHLPHSLNTADAQRLEVEWGGREMVFSLLNKSEKKYLI